MLVVIRNKFYNHIINVTSAYDDDKVSQWFRQCNTCSLWLEINFTIIINVTSAYDDDKKCYNDSFNVPLAYVDDK